MKEFTSSVINKDVYFSALSHGFPFDVLFADATAGVVAVHQRM